MQKIIIALIITITVIIFFPTASAEKIVVGIYDNLPLVFYESNENKAKGIFIDILEYIAEKESWEIVYYYDNFPSLLEKLKRGEIDLLVDIAYSEERDKIFDFNNETVITNWGVVYAREKLDSIMQLEGLRIAGVKSDVYFENLKELAKSFGIKCDFIEIEGDYSDVLNSVKRGDADAGVVSRIYGKLHARDLQRTSIIFSPIELRFASPEGRGELLQAIDKHLMEMKADENSVLFISIDRWLGRGVVKPVIPEWLAYSVIFFGIVAFFVAFRNFYVERELEKRTKDLKESEKKYRDLWENANDILYIHDLDGNFIEVNKAGRRIFGYSVEEIKGLNIKDVIDEMYLSKAIEKIKEKVLAGKHTEPYELLCKTKDGKPIWVEVKSRPIFEDGRVVAVQGIASDITKRVEMERKLRESEEKYRKIFENSPNIIAVVNEDGVFVEANPSMAKSLGTNPINKTFYDVLPKEIAEERLEYVRKALKENRILTLQDARGGRYFINNFLPIELPGGKYCLIISQEVTEIKRLNMLLNAINNISKLMLHEKDKQKFLRKVCEELASLEDFSPVTICLVEDGKIIPVVVSGERKEVLERQKECKVIKEAVKCKSMVVKSEETCDICEIKRDEFKQVLSIPMVVDNEVKGVVTLYVTTDGIIKEEMELLERLANDLAFALKAIELDELKRRAHKQIEKNIEEFAILVDHIRNPLAAISLFAELKVQELDKELAENIIKQVKRIEDVIKRLDEGWLESENIREFLRKY